MSEFPPTGGLKMDRSLIQKFDLNKYGSNSLS